jgi:hypothetical protein
MSRRTLPPRWRQADRRRRHGARWLLGEGMADHGVETRPAFPASSTITSAKPSTVLTNRASPAPTLFAARHGLWAVASCAAATRPRLVRRAVRTSEKLAGVGWPGGNRRRTFWKHKTTYFSRWCRRARLSETRVAVSTSTCTRSADTVAGIGIFGVGTKHYGRSADLADALGLR